MPKTYTWRLHVRTYELDQFAHVNNAVYLNYLEEAATQASAAVGYDWDWYTRHQCFWLIRKMTIRYFQPAMYGDELEVKTWVSDFRRVRSNREYEITRVRDGERIVRARADWVFVDEKTLQPKRIFDEFPEAYGVHNEPLEDLGVRLRNAETLTDSHRFISYREVQSYELDSAKHVNNSIYLRWIEHAYNSAINSVNWPLERQMREHQFAILAAAHEIEYFKSALEGDRIKIISRVVEVARVRGAWIHEIRNAATDELLAEDYAVGAFVDLSSGTPKPTRIPQVMLEAAVTGVPN